MAEWGYTKDVIVVGSGGGGMVAAIVAGQARLDTLIVEKTGAYGGSTALSGGGMWIPNNYPERPGGMAEGKIRPVGMLPAQETGLTDGQKMAIGAGAIAALLLLLRPGKKNDE